MPPTTRVALVGALIATAAAVAGTALPSPANAAKVVTLWLKANGNDVAMVDDPALWIEGEIRKALRQQGRVLTDSDVNELAKRAGSALGRGGAKDISVCTQSGESCLVIELVE